MKWADSLTLSSQGVQRSSIVKPFFENSRNVANFEYQICKEIVLQCGIVVVKGIIKGYAT